MLRIYQQRIKELKKFISSPDVFGVNKKVTAEITIIKMTSPSSVLSLDSLSDRLSRLENAVSCGEALPKKEEKKAPKKPAVEPVKKEEKPKAVSSSNKDVFEHTSEFVRKFGEKEPMNKFFMDVAKIRRSEKGLVISTNALACSMLKSATSLSSALEIAKELDPEIETISVVEENATSADTQSKNSDLDNL